MKRYLLAVLLSILLTLSPAIAAAGKKHFLSFSPGTAAAGMGDAFTAAGDNSSVIFYNPALLSHLDGQEFSGMHYALFDGARLNYAAYSAAYGGNAFGLSWLQFNRAGVEKRLNIDDDPIMIENTQSAIYAAYSGIYKPYKLNYGLAVKYIDYHLDSYGAFGLGADVGFARRLMASGNPSSRYFTLDTGLNLQNLYQMPIKLISEKEDLPLMTRIGIAGTVTLFPKYNRTTDYLSYDTMRLAADIVISEGNTSFNAGMQYLFMDRFALRFGWANGLSAGLGLVMPAYLIDYAYRMKDLDNFHQFSFSFRFGQSQNDPKAATPSFTDEFQTIFTKAGRIYDRYYKEAADFAQRGEYKKAIDLLRRAIPLRPDGNKDAIDLISTCKASLSSQYSNNYLTAARSYQVQGDMKSAYDNCLSALLYNPNEQVASILRSIYALADDRSSLNTSKYSFTKGLLAKINAALENYAFVEADKLFLVLSFVADGPDYGPSEYKSTKSLIADKKELYIFKCLSCGMDQMKKANPGAAYVAFKEARALRPNDPGIRDQVAVSKEKYIALRHFSIADDVYSDKLYYIAAVKYAINENTLPSYNELTSFNIIYKNTHFLTDVLQEDGIIKRQLSQ